MLKKTTNNQKGFTIIEVLIVLAIAGLILLIVFLAVPALQRNSRNTQYRTEAANLLTAAEEFTTNNNGAVPVATDRPAVLALTKTKSISDISIETAGATDLAPTFSTARIRTGVKCGAATGTGATYSTVAGSTRSMVIVFAVEKGDGTVQAQCVEG